ncbi:hypothetical protein LXL04_014275 [Taraxacum kok-saghyz]
MSSRSTGSSSQSDVSKARKVPFRRCYCGLSAPFSTSWSDNNPGRSEWYTEVLNKLKPKKKSLKFEGTGDREASVLNLVRVMIGLFVIFMIMVLVLVLLCLLLKG